jgi:phage protein D
MAASDRSQPIYFVKVAGMNGERLDLTERVLSFSYEDSDKKADKLVLTVDNWDLSNFDNPIWRKGQILEASWGFPGNMAPTRQAVIQKVTGFQTLNIEALDKSILMNKVAQVRTFENMRRSDIVRKIAEENGYGPEVQDIGDTEHVLPHVTQAGMTDAQFLSHLAQIEANWVWYIDDLGFHFVQRPFNQDPVRVLHWFTPPEVGEIISINVENDVTGRAGEVIAKGRDPLHKRDFTITAGNAGTRRLASSPALEIFGIPDALSYAIANSDVLIGKGLSKLLPAPKPPPKPKVKTKKNGNGSGLDIVGGTYVILNKLNPATIINTASRVIHAIADADGPGKHRADGAWLRDQQNTVQLTAHVLGDPNLLAKTVVEFRGISQRLSGLYYVEEAKHKIDGSGYTVDLKCKRDGTSERQGVRPKAQLSQAQIEKAKQLQRVVENTIALVDHVLPTPLSGLVEDGIKDVLRTKPRKPVVRYQDTRGRGQGGKK